MKIIRCDNCEYEAMTQAEEPYPCKYCGGLLKIIGEEINTQEKNGMGGS